MAQIVKSQGNINLLAHTDATNADEEAALVIYCDDLLLVEDEGLVRQFYDEAVGRGAQVITDLTDKDFVLYPVYDK